MIEKEVRSAVARLGLDVEDLDDESVTAIHRHMGYAPRVVDQRELNRELLRAYWLDSNVTGPAPQTSRTTNWTGSSRRWPTASALIAS